MHTRLNACLFLLKKFCAITKTFWKTFSQFAILIVTKNFFLNKKLKKLSVDSFIALHSFFIIPFLYSIRQDVNLLSELELTLKLTSNYRVVLDQSLCLAEEDRLYTLKVCIHRSMFKWVSMLRSLLASAYKCWS